MPEDWLKVYSSSKLYEVEIIKGMLFENDIESVIINKQDSVYLFGDIELHVLRDNFLKAKQIIVKNNNSE
jgi:hypothetical protein